MNRTKKILQGCKIAIRDCKEFEKQFTIVKSIPGATINNKYPPIIPDYSDFCKAYELLNDYGLSKGFRQLCRRIIQGYIRNEDVNGDLRNFLVAYHQGHDIFAT